MAKVTEGSRRRYGDCPRCNRLSYDWSRLPCGHELCTDCHDRKKGRPSACRVCRPYSPEEHRLRAFATELRVLLAQQSPETQAALLRLGPDALLHIGIQHLAPSAQSAPLALSPSPDPDPVPDLAPDPVPSGPPPSPGLPPAQPQKSPSPSPAKQSPAKAAAASEELNDSAESFATAAEEPSPPRSTDSSPVWRPRPVDPDSVGCGRGLLPGLSAALLADLPAPAAARRRPGGQLLGKTWAELGEALGDELPRPNFRGAKVKTGGVGFRQKERAHARCLRKPPPDDTDASPDPR